MGDQIFARLWNDGHDRFSADVDLGLRRVAAAVGRKLKALPEAATHGLLMAAAVVASTATLTIATPAGAAQQAPIEVTSRSVAVSYGDLDLRTVAGRETLDGRVRQAARALCQPDIAGITQERFARRACFRDAIADAGVRIDQAAASFAQTRTGGAAISVAAR